MAASAAAEVTDGEEQKFLECGLCFENDELKRLPCNPDHIYCVTCLTKDSEKTKIIKCPTCSTVFDEGIDDIPSAGAPLDKFLCCDVCMRKEDKRKLAQIYCVICQKKFCKPHMDNHNAALDDHKRITMDEYKKEYRKVEIRRCEKHTDHVYSVACKKCNGVYCAKCVTLTAQRCIDGSSHDFADLQILADQFVKLINDMKLWIFDKEECLLGLVKQLTRILSDWDSDTEEMITKLHNARDKQIHDLTRKYEALEKTLLKLRTQSKSEVTSFLDDDVGSKLDKISRGVKRIDSRLYSHHQVDIVKSMKETEKLTEELINVEIPEYKASDNHVELVNKDTVLEAAIRIEETSEFPLTIPRPTKPNHVRQSNRSFQTNPTPQHPEPQSITNPPTSIEFVTEYTDLIRVKSVCHYKQYTHVGRLGGVDRISDDGQVQRGFINVPGMCCESITVHGDGLYILVRGRHQPSKIHIYDLSGNLIGNWKTSIDNKIFNKHCIIDNKLIIPDLSNKQLVVFSLNGDIIKHIPCDLCNDYGVAMNVGGDDSVIVTVEGSNIVFRINIDSGEVMWVSSHVTSPQGLFCYKKSYVLVTNYGAATRIWVLDINTGKYVGELTGKQRNQEMYRSDMEIRDDTLLVAGGDQLLLRGFMDIYKLKFDKH